MNVLSYDFARPAKKYLARHPNAVEWTCAALCSLASIALHPVASMLHAPYWLDEAWVALSVRAPLHVLPKIVASTPLGFSVLLRAIPDKNELRLLPLLCSGLLAGAAFHLG